MYSLSDIKKGLRNPRRLFRELNTLAHSRFGTVPHNTTGIDIFGEDWDNLILLDACRYDIFAEEADLPGQLDSRESRAAATPEFIDANFLDRTQHDTVYVTGNSWVLKKGADENLYLVYDVVQHPTEESEVNKPTLIERCAREAAEKHPNKRLLVHFIRPHHPFLGPTAQELFGSRDDDDQPHSLYTQVANGDLELSDETLETLYRENLQIVLPHVEELLETLEGKTVVSADHGELLGDRLSPLPINGYGHHEGLYVDELVRVPWHVHTNGERRSITEDEPVPEPDRSYSMADQSVDDRLRDLGYKT